ncbi:helix-turn-helix domain-containing protein [Desulfofustis glycolicus]|uniref:Helix-turn-helix n=1 Tax=Desulfofustis glycolicus DSM 9705 TaxID=1121409 RepID=A0A1M5XQ68_9BACT|nr:helix-turn-helix transcriptional regulator [Desulfofustis glycolicus]SHI01899.1 Helix-turn-helix [Desulfofustis glycolicus DSM 9705]
MKNVALKEAMLERGITQKLLEMRTKIPQPIISMAVNGRYNLDAGQKHAIASVIGKPARELFSEGGVACRN